MEFCNDASREYIAGLLVSQGVSRKTFNLEPWQKNGVVTVAGTTLFTDFDEQKAAYSDLDRDIWFFGLLWLNPNISSYTSGSPLCKVSLVTHGGDLQPVLFPVDLRSGISAVDGSYPSRLFFRRVLVAGLKVESSEAGSNFDCPFLFNGCKVSLR